MLKRNTITALWLLFMAVTETTVSQTALTECDYQKCLDKLKPGVNCRTVPEAIACAETTILPNPECSQDVKDRAREEIQKGEDYIREDCQVNDPTVTQTTPTECGYQQCLDILRRFGVHCGTVPVAIECANTTVLPNPQCSESVKDETRRKILEGEEYISEHCQGPNCNAEKCLEGVNKYGLTCGTVREGLQCAETTILNIPYCPTSLKDQVEEAKTFAVAYLAANCSTQEPGGVQP